MTDEKDHAAIHEAGHAVVAVGLHLKVDHVALLRSGRLAGRVRTWRFDSWDRPSPWAQMALSLAGYVSETIADKSQFDLGDRLLLEETDDDDMHVALAAAKRVYKTEARAWRALEHSERRVERWLRRHWSFVETTARALAEQRSVSGTALYEIAGSLRVPVRDWRLLPASRPFFEAEMTIV